MKHTKLLIFVIAIAFMLSLNFACAVDENDSQIINDIDEDALSSQIDEVVGVNDDSQDDVVNAAEEDVVSIETDRSDNIVKESPQIIKMNGIVKRVNGGIWYKATFYDDSGNPLKDNEVFFSLNDEVLGWKVATDSNGVAILKAAISNGNYKLNAFSPLAPDNPVSTNIKVFNVITGGKNINMYYDDGTTYKVRVFDDNGNPVKAGQKVTFKIDNKKYVKKTDKNGFAKLKIPSTPGLYVISVTYKDFTISNNLKVKQVLKAKTGKVKGKSKIKFKVTFLGKNKKNKLVKVKFNKKTYKAKTNKKGVAIFNLKVPKKLGRYNVVVSYKKTKDYYIYTQSRV